MRTRLNPCSPFKTTHNQCTAREISSVKYLIVMNPFKNAKTPIIMNILAHRKPSTMPLAYGG